MCTKMCDVKWLQDGWEPKVGDWTDKGVVINIDRHGHLSIGTYEKNIFALKESIPDLIWLPSIGQLMGMVESKITENIETTHAYVKGGNKRGFVLYYGFR